MMTPQDIREKVFEKAVFGGYDMGAVDDFLEDISADYTALSKENSVLKSKMKVLVEKIEEYRATEDAMRLALLNAQRMGEQMESEAKANSEKIVADAKAEADRITRDAQLELDTQNARLAEAQKSSAKFIENMRLLCSKQLAFFDAVNEMELIPPQADEPVDSSIDETFKNIESSVARAAEEPALDIDIGQVSDSEDEPTRLFSLNKTEAEFADEPTSRFSFTKIDLEADRAARQN